MISPAYCQMMARYGAWQNHSHAAAMAKLTELQLLQERGAFFGSIQATANHLLWGDWLWMSRFDGGAPPEGGIASSGTLTSSLGDWAKQRKAMDARIAAWAQGLTQADVDGDLVFHSKMLGREMREPKSMCITHFFNHQTHHRGQIHAMLTAAGVDPGDSDLFLMPKDTPWL